MARYVALFNRHDWDGLRAMLADDVRLIQSSYPLRAGAADVGMFLMAARKKIVIDKRWDIQAGAGSPFALGLSPPHRTGLAAGFGHRDLDGLRVDRRVVCDMRIVAQKQLKRVRAQLQLDRCLGLAGAEVQMIEVVRNRLVERRQWSVDQQMVMSGIGLVDAGGCHAHVKPRPIGGCRPTQRAHAAYLLK